MNSSTTARPAGYLLTKIAQVSAGRFAERIAGLHIRPKHYGLLAVTAAVPGSSQQQLGRLLGLVPSAIVTMIDDLEALGAVVRTTDPGSRRQFAIEITPAGSLLLTQATELGAEVDDEIFGQLTAHDRTQFSSLLATIARSLDIPRGNAESPPG